MLSNVINDNPVWVNLNRANLPILAKTVVKFTSKKSSPVRSASLEDFLKGADNSRRMTVERKDHLAALLVEKLIYCDELVEYFLADEKVLVATCTSSMSENLSILKAAVDSMARRFNKLRI